MKIAILHDYFEGIGGGETEMKMLAEGLARKHEINFYTSYFNHSLPFKLNVPLEEIGCRFLKHNGLRQMELAWRFSHLSPRLEKYNAIITENYWSVFAKHKNHIHHCEAPIRQFYDLRGLFAVRMPTMKRMLFNISADTIIHFEQKAVQKVKTIVANSEFTKTRVKLYYNRDDSVVIYPPVITKDYNYKKTGNYFLYLGRFSFNKRIEFMIEAFKKSGKRFVAIGGGDLLEKAKQMAKGYKNITFLGYQPDEVVREYMANCMAMVYLPVFEDFGQVPVEGMAAGKPCLGVKEGGLLETIIDGKTGWLFLPRMKDIVEAIKSIKPEECRSMRRNCETQAKKFDIEPYLDQFNKVIKNTVEG